MIAVMNATQKLQILRRMRASERKPIRMMKLNRVLGCAPLPRPRITFRALPAIANPHGALSSRRNMAVLWSVELRGDFVDRF